MKYEEIFDNYEEFKNDPALKRIINETMVFVGRQVERRTTKKEFDNEMAKAVTLVLPIIVAYIRILIDVSHKGPEKFIDIFEDKIHQVAVSYLRKNENLKHCRSASGG